MVGIMVSLGRVAFAHQRRGDYRTALRHLTEAVGIARRAAAADPDNVELVGRLAGSLDHSGNVRAAMMDWEDARRDYMEALSITRRLVAATPDNPARARDLMLAASKVGGTYAAQNRPRDAQPFLEEGVSIARRLHAANPQAFDTTWDLAGMLQQAAIVQIASRDFDAAWSGVEESIRHLEALRVQTPDNPAVLEPLAIGLIYRGGLQMESGDRAGARRDFETARDILEPLQRTAQNPITTQLLNMTRSALASLGPAHRN
jgi:tetratricopeptide (TPR) repeat protein